jgi:hypothetical protein
VARHNLRVDQGDRRGARKLAIVVASGGVIFGILRAHHVPDAIQEATFLLAIAGWSLVWAGFTWLTYISLEPYVRRLWPTALISWTRLLSGRIRDPLVGRDILIGLIAGIASVGSTIVRYELTRRAVPTPYLEGVLDSLRSARLFIAHGLALPFLDGIQYGLGGA